jgi:hypothetical protein
MLPTQEFERQEGFWITIKPNALSLFTGTRDQISSLGNNTRSWKTVGVYFAKLYTTFYIARRNLLIRKPLSVLPRST